MTAAVLPRPVPDGAPSPVRPRPGSAPDDLPTLIGFALAAVLLAVGALPVVDVLFVLTGLLVAVLGRLAGLASPAGSPRRWLPGPAAALAGAALLHAGTGSAVTLLLLTGPVAALAGGAGRRGALAGAAGAALAAMAPGLLTGAPVGLAVPLLATAGAAAAGFAVADLAALQRSRDAELDVATRMLAARARTMTSVIDAVTEQSIIGTDVDGVVRVWNPGAERLLGLPRHEVVRGRSIVDFHLSEELAAAAEAAGTAPGLAALVHAAQENGSDVRDWTYVAADGSRRTVSVAITPRTDDRGEHAGWNFVGTDMTEARATERLKDQFVSLISHELRTPLSSILGYLELVLDEDADPLTDEQRQFLTTVERNAHRLQRLVGDLLFTAQVEAGRFTLQPADVDLAGVVRAAEETARVTAAAGGVELVVAVPDDGLVVRGDAVRLGQACDNLVFNAVKFTPPGGRVTLSLRAGWRAADGRVVDGRVVDDPGSDGEPVAVLSVRDTGVGIPAGEQKELFTRFFRASTARRNAVPGVGLGLTITKAITTAHGGTIEVDSAEGEGTTFTLVLPAAR
ncbi:PAS domain-containing sensor histidine kinase [Geodermatophilus sp. YIM 151500]|uniref:sensor histidine kinase n=1 Tax=Geodermatophilus sp. YIM 151500 TaxID=2984531 RepID=UPI0021E499C0|nr:PAS domain-containing sensor histidine kinase [Geodermatophilus sp. YIM 151500]MCV2491601.1 PAS domain-containing sensor histidine kinase [Geodermatophilus sp. YIM 151500]